MLFICFLETGFIINRIYLLIAPILGLVLPVLKFPILNYTPPLLKTVKLPALKIKDSTQSFNGVTIIDIKPDVIILLWLVGVAFFFYLFIKKLYVLHRIKKSATPTYINKTRVYIIPNSKDCFTFLNTICIGDLLPEDEKQTIFLHENIHKTHRHGWDLVFYELLRVIFWFNPLLYFFQKELKLLHEYIADCIVIKQINKKAYYQKLLSQVFNTSDISFVNTFFNKYSLKNRIIMLQKSNQKPSKIKYLLLIPIISSLIFYSSCTQQSKSVSQNIADLKVALEEGSVTIEDKQALEDLLNNFPPAPPTPANPFEDREFTFETIDKSPVYPGCEGDNEALKKCFSEKIHNLVSDNFDVNLAKKLHLTGKQRITAMFKIDKNGKITNIKVRASHPDLEKETKRVLQLLPKMTPGEFKYQKVGVLYSLPIIFEI